jgi:hypothetical protein
MTVSSSPQKSDQLPVKKIPVHIKVKENIRQAQKIKFKILLKILFFF